MGMGMGMGIGLGMQNAAAFRPAFTYLQGKQPNSQSQPNDI